MSNDETNLILIDGVVHRVPIDPRPTPVPSDPPRPPTSDAPLAQRLMDILRGDPQNGYKASVLRTSTGAREEDLRATLSAMIDAGDVEVRRVANTTQPKFRLRPR